MIETLSPRLQRALAEACSQVNPSASNEADILAAMKIVVAKIDRGETGLFDPCNAGDQMALALARI